MTGAPRQAALLHRYAAWLDAERLALVAELHPAVAPCEAAKRTVHGPPPSTRAAVVLAAAGVRLGSIGRANHPSKKSRLCPCSAPPIYTAATPLVEKRSSTQDDTMTPQLQTAVETEYMTEGQLCALIHVNPRTTQRWRRSDDGPNFTRAGKFRVLYRRSDVDAWLASRTFEHRAAEATNRPVAV